MTPLRVVRVPVTIKRVNWMLPRWAAAQVVLPQRIHVRATARLDRRLLAHELAHVTQWHQIGWTFPLRYLWELRRGYRNNAFEAQARAYEHNPLMLAWADDLLLHNQQKHQPPT